MHDEDDDANDNSPEILANSNTSLIEIASTYLSLDLFWELTMSYIFSEIICL